MDESRGKRLQWARALRAGALAASGIGAGMLGVSAYAAYRLSRPRRCPGEIEPVDESHERIRFPSTDGFQMAGWFLPSAGGSSAVILCHGFHTGRREMLPIATALRSRGYHVLLFDFRAHGESEGSWTSCGLLETRDLEGAVRYLLARPETAGKPIAVVGFSMGGAVALLTAARVTEIGAVVADSSFATFQGVLSTGFRALYGLPSFPIANLALWFSERLIGVRADDIRPIDAIAELSPRPVLLIHGTEDRIVPLSEAYLLYESAGEPRELWTVAGTGHVEAHLQDFQGYLDRVDGFLKKSLTRDTGAAGRGTTPADSCRS